MARPLHALCACALALYMCCSRVASAKSVLQAQDDFTTLWKADGNWAVQQRQSSCGLVWLNQTSHGRSTYTVTHIDGAGGCAAGDKVYVQLVEIGTGPKVTAMFEALCNGDLRAGEYSKHVTARAGWEGSTRSASLSSTDTVYLMVRNECAEPAVVTVEHDVELMLLIPLSPVIAASQVALVVLLALLLLVGVLTLCRMCEARRMAQLQLAASVAGCQSVSASKLAALEAECLECQVPLLGSRSDAAPPCPKACQLL